MKHYRVQEEQVVFTDQSMLKDKLWKFHNRTNLYKLFKNLINTEFRGKPKFYAII